jgi:LuxR family transcriptional regulator, maltose regulon positive regulatory protein
MLRTLVRLGETGRAEQAVTRADETGRGEMRNALGALRLAQGDPQAAADALAPILDGSAPVTNLGWVTEAFLLEAFTPRRARRPSRCWACPGACPDYC